MHSASDRCRFPVQLTGRSAWRLLERPQRGRVLAAFRSTFYVELDSGLACVGRADLDPSPLNLITSAPARTHWQASGVRPGMPVWVSNGTLLVGDRFSFPLGDAEIWSPEAPPVEINAEILTCGLGGLRREARSRTIADGLGGLFDPAASVRNRDAVMCRAREPASEARRWVASLIKGARESAEDCKWVGALAGLGQGLTPSGDDFIGGAMIALRVLGEDDACDRIWIEARCQPDIKSNPISFAHLSAAAAGEGSAPIHRLLNDVVTGRTDQIAAGCEKIDRIGHSSGWDAVAGMSAVLAGWLDARRY